MKQEARKKYLEEVVKVLKEGHVTEILQLSEGSFESREVKPAEISFRLPNKLGYIANVFQYVQKEIKKENFLCDILWECDEEGLKDKKYRFSIESVGIINPDLYEEQTRRILHRVPHIIKDYKQKFRKKK